MKTAELRDMTQDELAQKLNEQREALFNLKFQHVTGQLENTAQLTRTRKAVARIATILNQKGPSTAA